MNYDYGDLEGVKTLLQINEAEYENLRNDNLLLDCLNLARIDFDAYQKLHCLEMHDICEDYYLDNIVNLLAVSYVYLTTESNMDQIIKTSKSQDFQEKAYFLLDSYKNKFLAKCSPGNHISSDTVVVRGGIPTCKHRNEHTPTRWCHGAGNIEQVRRI